MVGIGAVLIYRHFKASKMELYIKCAYVMLKNNCSFFCILARIFTSYAVDIPKFSVNVIGIEFRDEMRVIPDVQIARHSF